MCGRIEKQNIKGLKCKQYKVVYFRRELDYCLPFYFLNITNQIPFTTEIDKVM